MLRRVLTAVLAIYVVVNLARWAAVIPPFAATAVPDDEGPNFGRLLAGSGGKFWPSYSNPVFRLVAADESDQPWPVSVAQVRIGCIAEAGPMTTMIVVDRKPYALNGLTKGWVRKHGFALEIDGVAVPVSTEDYPEWWVRPSSTPRVGLGPLFERAEALGCLDINAVNRL